MGQSEAEQCCPRSQCRPRLSNPQIKTCAFFLLAATVPKTEDALEGAGNVLPKSYEKRAPNQKVENDYEALQGRL